MYCDNDNCFEICQSNIQDLHVAGTVVFRGNIFPTICHMGMEEIGIVMSAYHTSFERKITGNQGIFHMTKERQSNMASRNMGVCGNTSHNHYYNDTTTNTLLVPFTSPLTSVMNAVTTLARHVADMSATCRRHVHMSPLSRRHCMSIRHREGSDICFF